MANFFWANCLAIVLLAANLACQHASEQAGPRITIVSPVNGSRVPSDFALEFLFEVFGFPVGEGVGSVNVWVDQSIPEVVPPQFPGQRVTSVRAVDSLYDLEDLGGALLVGRDFNPGHLKLFAQLVDHSRTPLDCADCSAHVVLEATGSLTASESQESSTTESTPLPTEVLPPLDDETPEEYEMRLALQEMIIAASSDGEPALSTVETPADESADVAGPDVQPDVLTVVFMHPQDGAEIESQLLNVSISVSLSVAGCGEQTLGVFLDGKLVYRNFMELPTSTGVAASTAITFQAHQSRTPHSLVVRVIKGTGCARLQTGEWGVRYVVKPSPQTDKIETDTLVPHAPLPQLKQDAFFTYVGNDNMVVGAVVLACTLARYGNAVPLYIVVDPDVSEEYTEKLSSHDVVLVEPTDEVRGLLTGLSYARRKSLCKISLWTQTAVSKGVYLDADILIQETITWLFSSQSEFSAAGTKELFDLGVFSFTPSMGTYEALLRRFLTGDFQLDPIISHFGVEGRFSPMPYRFNVRPQHSEYAFSWLHGMTIAVVHFKGPTKPWNWANQTDPGPTTPSEHIAWPVIEHYFNAWGQWAFTCLNDHHMQKKVLYPTLGHLLAQHDRRVKAQQAASAASPASGTPTVVGNGNAPTTLS